MTRLRRRVTGPGAPDCSGGMISRRHFLLAGSLGAGLPLDSLLASRTAAGEVGGSLILIYLHGGPSHLETFDLKPEAPTSHRSVFKAIGTTVPGIEICEHLPKLAAQARRFALVRSLHHDVNIHSDGGIVVLTGKRPETLDPTSQSKSKHPDIGHVVSAVRPPGAIPMPPYVSMPSAPYMTRPNYAGAHRAPLVVQSPDSRSFRPPGLALPAQRGLAGLENRRALLARIDRFRRENDPSGQMGAVEDFRGKAFEMLTSPEVAGAFDVAKEPEATRDRYGRHLWGNGFLLARRLAEAGTAVTTLFLDSAVNSQEHTNWDDHIMNAGRPGHFATFMERRLPYLDQALSALIADLYDRGSEQKVMVAVFGEFGRTPRLSSNSNGTGRDHWPDAYSALLAGGGLRTGQVVGATNEKGEYPTERPLGPGDLLATMYRHLGVNPSQTLTDHTGRPVAILEHGAPIAELVG